MTGMGRSSDNEPGSGGSEYDADTGHFPAVPYTMDAFNTKYLAPCLELDIDFILDEGISIFWRT